VPTSPLPEPRSDRRPIRVSPPLPATTIGVVLIEIWLPTSTLGGVLGLASLPLAYWPFLASVALAYMVVTPLVRTRLHAHGAI
jgi:hypothetical protein